MYNLNRIGVTLVALALALICTAASAGAASQVVLLVGDNQSLTTAKAIALFQQRHSQLKNAIQFEMFSEASLESLPSRDLGRVNLLLLDSHSQNRAEKLEKGLKTKLIRAVAARGKVLVLGHSLTPNATYNELGARFDEKIRQYWDAEGSENLYAMLCLIANSEVSAKLHVPPVVQKLQQGFYHPHAAAPRSFATYEAFLAWYSQSGRLHKGKPWVAVSFFGSSLYQEQTAVLDQVIAKLEESSINALPMFGYPDKKLWQELLLDKAGTPRAQAVLSFTFRFSGPETQQIVRKAAIPIFNLIKIYARSEDEWRTSRTGLSIFEGVFQIDVPELNGLLSPLVVGSEEKRLDETAAANVVVGMPIPERVDMAVRRVRRYLTLQTKPNADKRIALLYYNYPPGKANIGASYLNSLRSISNMLNRLREEGYNVGKGPLTEAAVTERALKGGRNVGSYAPGELQALVGSGKVILVPRARYEQLFATLPETYRKQVAKDWGEPDVSEGMWVKGKAGIDMVVPAVTYGNIVVMPQPDRGFGQDLQKLYHSMDVTPPHHYAGVYRWLRDDFKADAIVHVGTHGTLEWLSGKSLGLSEADAPDVMIDELPDSYVYNVDVVGEGLVAKRRGGANLVDHMIPSLKKGGIYGDIAKLYELVNDHDSAQTKDHRMSELYAEQIRAMIKKLGLERDLGLSNTKGELAHDDVHRLQDYLLELKNKNMPVGLHTFGNVPNKALRDGTVAAVLEAERGWNPFKKAAMGADLDKKIQESGPRELESWLVTLQGGYVPVGTGNDPIRNPDSLPTGKDFYGVDPSKIPKKAAWELGVRLADQMIRDHKDRLGHFPSKVAFVIWGNETIRNEGVSESQFFHLLGTRPVWNERGKVIDVEVIPRSKLGRPRIDVVISSAAEGMFSQLTQLMDKAVQKINLLEEPENYAREHTLATAAKLKAKGYDDEQALKRASVRIFDEPPGQYNLNVSRIAQNSGSWEKETVLSNDYFQKMGHGYGNGFWGENMEDVFRLTLSGTEKVVHSASSNLYGTLDNDDFFMYAGGLVQAIRHLDGKSPELMVADLQKLGNEKMTPIARFMGMEFKNRPMNPEWIKGMMAEGYAGAHEMRDHLENLWGWQVTVPEAVGQEKWNETFETYVVDKNRLGLEAFFEKSSPSARQDMVARLLETVRKGHWQPNEAVRGRLASEFVKSAQQHGMSCVSFVCQNPGLAEFTAVEAAKAGVAARDVQAFTSRVEEAMQKKVSVAAAAMKEFVKATENRHEARKQSVNEAKPPNTDQVKGLVMEKKKQTESQSKKLFNAAAEHKNQLAATFAILAFGVFGWWRVRKGMSGK